MDPSPLPPTFASVPPEKSSIMPLDAQALSAMQAAAHFVPSRDHYNHARADIRLDSDAASLPFMAHKPPRPRRMRFLDIPRVVRTVQVALKDSHDPVRHYLVDTPDFRETRWTMAVTWCSLIVMYVLHVMEGTAWVIQGGESFLVAQLTPARERKPQSPLLKWISDYFYKYNGPFGYIFTAEQRNRLTEIYEVQTKTAKETLGEKKQDMLFVSTIATAPTSQHRGYASTLIQLVTDEADRRGRATYLFSSNHEANVPFYNSLGFYAVTTYQVGDTNPTWNERPVVVGVMVREPPLLPTHRLDWKDSNV